MDVKLPPEIAVTDLWPASVEFVLPRRDLGRGRIFGWLLLGLGLSVAGLLIYSILAAWMGVPWVLGKSFRSFVFFLSLPTLGGTVPLWWGLVSLAGHRKLVIRGPWLRTIERCGPFWWGKRWRIATIRSFDVIPISGDRGAELPEILKPFNALLARFEGAGQGMLAWGYPEDLLRNLAGLLEQKCNAALEREGLQGTIGSTAKIEQEQDEDLEDDEDQEQDGDGEGVRSKPADSPIEIERYDGGLSIRVPPAGLWKGTSGLFFFSLLWNGFMTVFTTLGAFAMAQGKAAQDDGLWIGVLFVSVFWLIGIGLLLVSLNMAWRKAGIAVADGTLMILTSGLFGSKQREWPASELAAIRVGPSGMEVNKRPVMELQIHGQDGKKFGLLSGRTDAELAWLAWELRQAMKCPSMRRNPRAGIEDGHRVWHIRPSLHFFTGDRWDDADLAGHRSSRRQVRAPAAGRLQPRNGLWRRPGRDGPPLGRPRGQVPAPGRSGWRPRRLDRESARRCRRSSAAVDVPCELGGGIRDEATIDRCSGIGLSRLVVGTRALKEPDWFRQMCRRFPGKLALGIDAKAGLVATDGWLETSTTQRHRPGPAVCRRAAGGDHLYRHRPRRHAGRAELRRHGRDECRRGDRRHRFRRRHDGGRCATTGCDRPGRLHRRPGALRRNALRWPTPWRRLRRFRWRRPRRRE